MTFYADLAATATDLLTELGEVGAIRRTTVSGGGPSAGAGTTTTTDYACRVAILPVDQRDIDGTLIKAGDWRAFVAALAIVPTTTDKLVHSEGVLTIVDAGKYSPAGTVTHYEMIVRRA